MNKLLQNVYAQTKVMFNEDHPLNKQLRTALAQAEQEICKCCWSSQAQEMAESMQMAHDGCAPMYLALQQEKGCAECGVKTSDGYALYCVKCRAPVREWVGLTYLEKEVIIADCTDEEQNHWVNASAVADLIEAKLKEKNSA